MREEVKLLQMRLTNCQSWEDGIINFSPGLNIIRADNNTGKSVIFKMLKITCKPDSLTNKERKELIRRGQLYAEVTYMFSDYSAAIVRVFKERVIYYFCKNVNTEDFSQQEGVPHHQLMYNLGLLVDYESGYIANILDDDQPLLLVKSDNKSNYNLIKVLTEHPQLNKMLVNFKVKYPEYRRELQEVKGKKTRLEQNLKTVRYVDEEVLDIQIKTSEQILESLDILIDMYKIVLDIEKIPSNEKPLDELAGVTSFLGNLETIVNNIHMEAKDIPNEMLDLVDLFKDMKIDLQKEIPKEFRYTFKVLENINRLHDNIKEYNYNPLLEEIDNLHVVENLLSSSTNLYNNLSKRKKILKTIEELESIDFEGEEYDCPLHGRIKVISGKCEPI